MKVAEVRRLLWASGLMSGPDIADPDISKLAATLIAHLGEEAPAEAAMRAEVLLDKGDLDGWAVWMAIAKAVGEFLATDFPNDATRH